jgi:bifunctional oligoribonuclease and PAP phosphatase NrnA
MKAMQETTAYTSNTTYAQVAARIRSADRIALLSHAKVDGDGLGAMLAVKRAVDPLGKSTDIFVVGPIEPNLLIVTGETPLHRVEESPPNDEYDLILVVDTGAWSQLEVLSKWLKRHHERIIVIDHHSRGSADIGAMRIVDPRKASTTQMVVELLDALECEITGGPTGTGIAEPLFLGLATDTGWFRYASADWEVFAVASRLLKAGVDKSGLYQIIEEGHRPVRLKLEARALASIEYANGGTIALMSLAREDFEETGGVVEDLTGVVNLPLIVGAVRMSILFAQSEANVTKVSFRSKPPLPGLEADACVDVNVLAQRFGGGGHKHAAGARLRMDLEDAKAAVKKVLAELKVGAGR